ncbi:hypothetical protein IWX49DRAFT_582278 [Phyllosticta citricarpa]
MLLLLLSLLSLSLLHERLMDGRIGAGRILGWRLLLLFPASSSSTRDLPICLSGWLAGVDQGLDMPTLMGLPFYFAVPSIALAQRTPLLLSLTHIHTLSLPLFLFYLLVQSLHRQSWWFWWRSGRGWYHSAPLHPYYSSMTQPILYGN